MPVTTAAVSRDGREDFSVEEVHIEDPRPDEVLVRFTAVGLCHTDLEVAGGRLPTPLPVVGGHEGTGVIEALGDDVDNLAVGDRVIAGFNFCGHCMNCQRGQPAYCTDHFPLNFGAQRSDGTVGLRDKQGQPVHDHFFGQSSFAGLGLCRPAGLVKIVDNDIADAILAPLACAVSTGAGAVWNSLQVTPRSSVLVVGAGPVGLSAVLAAIVAGAGRAIVADQHTARLELATQLGASDVIDIRTTPTLDAVTAMTGGHGVDFSVECTGVASAMTDAAMSLAPLGRAAVLGLAPPQEQFRTHAFSLVLGRTVMGSVVGHQAPVVLIPRILTLHRQGRFPVERLVSCYPLAAINEAVAAVHAGTTIKAVLNHQSYEASAK